MKKKLDKIAKIQIFSKNFIKKQKKSDLIFHEIWSFSGGKNKIKNTG